MPSPFCAKLLVEKSIDAANPVRCPDFGKPGSYLGKKSTAKNAQISPTTTHGIPPKELVLPKGIDR